MSFQPSIVCGGRRIDACQTSDEPLSVLDIANALGVSLRSLQLAFAEVYGGLTPRDVLNGIRLEKARTRLLAATGTASYYRRA